MDGFKLLGQLATNRDLLGRTDLGQQIEQCLDPVRSFEQQLAALAAAQGQQRATALARLGRQKAGKLETLCNCIAGHAERSYDAAGARNRQHAQARRCNCGDQHRPGVGDRWRAGIADIGNPFALAEPLHHGSAGGMFVVLVQGDQRPVQS